MAAPSPGPLARFLLPCLLIALAVSACSTVSPGQTSRSRLDRLFLSSREGLLTLLPDEIRAAAQTGENEITVAKSFTRAVYGMALVVRTETVAYRFQDGRLIEIEIRTASEPGALDADIAALRSLYRSLLDEYRARFGKPSAETQSTGPADPKQEGLQTITSADTSWGPDRTRQDHPSLSVTLLYRERSVQGAVSVRLREVYGWQPPASPAIETR